jgi:prepilin-type N-terminal cleavage/methylation domain-containing protein
MPTARRRGLTLLELMIVIGVLAVLSTLALPSMGRQLERHRLQAAAEALTADLAEARFEAARRGQALHLDVHPSTPWCWAVTTAPGCHCGTPQACQLRAVRAEDHRHVRLVAARPVRFDSDGRADGGLGAVLEAGSERLQVEVGVLGRARICDPQGRLPRVPRC